MSQLGYGGLIVGLTLDSMGPPIPSEVLLAVGGALAASGRFNLIVVLIIGTLAQVLGGTIAYLLGRYGGYPLLERYGKYVFISKRDLAKTHAAFERHGALYTMLGRCVPVVRGLIGYPAGIAGMKLRSFLIFTTIGSAIWTALFVTLGYTLGAHLEAVDQVLNKFSIIVVLLIVAAALWPFRAHLPRRHKPKAEGHGR